MKRLGTLLCAAVLCAAISWPAGAACGQATQPWESAAPVSAESQAATTEKPVPYTLALDALTPIFSGPGYDFVYARTVGEDGVYTIVEEAWDQEENLWGKLKSGVGWVNLTGISEEEAQKAPVSAGFVEDERWSPDGEVHEYIAGDAENGVKILFQANESLRDVRFAALEFEGASYREEEILYSLDEMGPEKPLVAQVVYYGDMTAYGLSFMDESSDTRRYYMAYISGRNGALILQEYFPEA